MSVGLKLALHQFLQTENINPRSEYGLAVMAGAISFLEGLPFPEKNEDRSQVWFQKGYMLAEVYNKET